MGHYFLNGAHLLPGRLLLEPSALDRVPWLLGSALILWALTQPTPARRQTLG